MSHSKQTGTHLSSVPPSLGTRASETHTSKGSKILNAQQDKLVEHCAGKLRLRHIQR